MSIRGFENIDDKTRSVLIDLFFNHVSIYPWKGVRQSPNYRFAKELTAIKAILVETQSSPGVKVIIKRTQTSVILDRKVFSIETIDRLAQNTQMSHYLDQQQWDETTISTICDKLKEFDHYVSAVVLAEEMQMERRRATVAQFVIPTLALIISLIAAFVTAFVTYLKMTEPRGNVIKDGLVVFGELVRRLF